MTLPNTRHMPGTRAFSILLYFEPAFIMSLMMLLSFVELCWNIPDCSMESAVSCSEGHLCFDRNSTSTIQAYLRIIRDYVSSLGFCRYQPMIWACASMELTIFGIGFGQKVDGYCHQW